MYPLWRSIISKFRGIVVASMHIVSFLDWHREVIFKPNRCILFLWYGQDCPGPQTPYEHRHQQTWCPLTNQLSYPDQNLIMHMSHIHFGTVHCEIWDRCIVWFVRLFRWTAIPSDERAICCLIFRVCTGKRKWIERRRLAFIWRVHDLNPDA